MPIRGTDDKGKFYVCIIGRRPESVHACSYVYGQTVCVCAYVRICIWDAG